MKHSLRILAKRKREKKKRAILFTVIGGGLFAVILIATNINPTNVNINGILTLITGIFILLSANEWMGCSYLKKNIENISKILDNFGEEKEFIPGFSTKQSIQQEVLHNIIEGKKTYVRIEETINAITVFLRIEGEGLQYFYVSCTDSTRINELRIFLNC